MKSRRVSLGRRLTALCTLLTAVALVLIGLDAYRRERAILTHGTATSLQTLARMVGVNVQAGLEFDARESVTEFLQTVVDTMDLQVAAVLDANGAVMALAGDPMLMPGEFEPSGHEGGDWVVAVPMLYKGSTGETRRAQVVVRASGEPLQRRLREYLAGQGITVLVALLVLGIAGHWLLRRLLRPIGTLVATTDQVRRTEDYGLRATAAADDEIGDLVHAFNAMLAAIEERDSRLGSIAQRLEQEVQQRTAELSHALETAELATRAKSTFIANMSHEIRTPLNAILGMTDLAAETEDPREVREYLGVIRSAGSNLLGILNDVLDLSKIESDKLELSPVPTDLEATVVEVLRPLSARIQGTEIDLVLDLSPDLSPGYQIDDVRFRQILTNLVGNAIKFTSRGHVRVGLSKVADFGAVHEIELVVEDTGVGIPADRLQAVFSPFTQADSTITRRFAGTGLGLSITDRLVRLMSGVIRVQSAVGVGTSFSVRVPFEVCESPQPPAPQPPADMRLHVVGCSESTQRALSAIAQRLGIGEILRVDRNRLGDDQPIGAHDVVLLDDRDQEGDGEIQRRVPIGVRGVRPVLLLTSFQELSSATARCRDQQFAGYLMKPVSARELAMRLQSLGAPPCAAPPVPAQAPARPAAPAAQLRILVAEDNPVNQKLIERLLQRDGHEVTVAENGVVCCEQFAAGRFDLVLMDMQMPEMSGIEATQRIRGDEAGTDRHVPIIALTANTTAEDRKSCFAAGMDEVLPKPVSMPKLREVLARYASPLERRST